MTSIKNLLVTLKFLQQYVHASNITEV